MTGDEYADAVLAAARGAHEAQVADALDEAQQSIMRTRRKLKALRDDLAAQAVFSGDALAVLSTTDAAVMIARIDEILEGRK